jgi:hypothetical protein
MCRLVMVAVIGSGGAPIREHDMSEHHLAMAGDHDDLPRTVRREKEAREREARERERGLHMVSPEPLATDREPAHVDFHSEPPAATVRRLDVPFLHLALVLLKAVVAAIPAIILLGVILWLMGQTLQTFFPHLVKMQILIRFPN